VAGGKAFRQAIEATMKGISLEEYAKTHKELAASIQTWGDPFKKGV
jgi:ribulose 1,5-bisphosphate carboxylase large subunit-like protein